MYSTSIPVSPYFTSSLYMKSASSGLRPSEYKSDSFLTLVYMYFILYHVALSTSPVIGKLNISWNFFTASSVSLLYAPRRSSISGIAG